MLTSSILTHSADTPPSSDSPTTSANAAEPTVTPTVGVNSNTDNLPLMDHVRYEYHPRSKRKEREEIVDLEEYTKRRRQPGGDRSRSKATADAKPPHFPFKTRIDFDFAELVFRTSMAKAEITQLLSLVRRCVNREDDLTFPDFDALQASWNEAQHLVRPVCCRYCFNFCRT